MPQVCWNANPRGEYWIDVELGGHPLQVLIDSGLIDAHGQVGFSINPSTYDRIKQSSGFLNRLMHTRLTRSRTRRPSVMPRLALVHHFHLAA